MSNKDDDYKVWVKNENDERKLMKLRKCKGGVIDNELPSILLKLLSR